MTPTPEPKRNLANIRLISFDLDDTLWDNKPVIRRASQDSLAFLDSHHDGAPTDMAILKHAKDAVVETKPQLAWNLTSLRQASYQYVLEANGVAPASAAKRATDATAIFTELRNLVEPFPEVAENLRKLSKEFSIAAITNGNCNLFTLDIGQYFSFFISPLQANCAKPAPAIYNYAAKHCGVAPEQVLHVGDCPRNDVEGAAKAGMTTAWYQNEGAVFDGKIAPGYQIRSLEELVTLLIDL